MLVMIVMMVSVMIVMVDFCGAISCGLQNFLVATREEGDSCHSNIKLHMASIGRYDVMNWCRSDKCGVLYLYVVSSTLSLLVVNNNSNNKIHFVIGD